MATVFCGTTSERFGFVARYQELGIERLCGWLDVSSSGYYAWHDREASKRSLEDQALLEEITRVYWASQGRYGSPRVFAALKAQGFAMGRKRVERLMRQAGLVARCVKVTRRTPNLKRFQKDGSNLLLEMSKPTAPNQVWVGDVSVPQQAAGEMRVMAPRYRYAGTGSKPPHVARAKSAGRERWGKGIN